jgi:hypothetical protein
VPPSVSFAPQAKHLQDILGPLAGGLQGLDIGVIAVSNDRETRIFCHIRIRQRQPLLKASFWGVQTRMAPPCQKVRRSRSFADDRHCPARTALLSNKATLSKQRAGNEVIRHFSS